VLLIVFNDSTFGFQDFFPSLTVVERSLPLVNGSEMIGYEALILRAIHGALIMPQLFSSGNAARLAPLKHNVVLLFSRAFTMRRRVTPQMLKAAQLFARGARCCTVARLVGVNQSTLWRWSTRHPGFQKELERCQNIERKRIAAELDNECIDVVRSRLNTLTGRQRTNLALALIEAMTRRDEQPGPKLVA
jgi:hypothetical protein